MIKTVVYCDFCEKPMPEDELDNVYLHRTKVFDTHAKYPHMCESCARKIDEILVAYKLEAAHQAGLASKFAQINAERKEMLGSEG